MYNKTIIEFGFRMISQRLVIEPNDIMNYQNLVSVVSADNADLGFDNS